MLGNQSCQLFAKFVYWDRRTIGGTIDRHTLELKSLEGLEL